MNWNIIRVDFDWPLTKVESPLIVSTTTLSACLGLGFYNPQTNAGYLLNRMLYEAGNARDLLLPEIAGKIEGSPADYWVFLSGMRCLCQPERGRVHDEAKLIDRQLDDILSELGFERKKIQRRYCGRRSLEGLDADFAETLEDEDLLERGEIVIDTQRGLAEIRISDKILPSYSVYCRVTRRMD